MAAINSNLRIIVVYALILTPLSLFAPSALQAAPPLEAYGHLPGVEIVRLSPSGERFAVIGVAGEKRSFATLHVNGDVEMTSGIGDAKIWNLTWADDEHVLFMYRATFSAPLVFRQDYEMGMVNVVNIRDRRASTIFEGKRTVGRVVMGYFGARRSEGRLMGYFGGIAYGRGSDGSFSMMDGYRDLFRVDLDNGEVKPLKDVEDRALDWVIGADGSITGYSEYLGKSGEWRLYDGSGNHQKLVQQVDPLSEIQLAGQGRTPGTVLVFDDSLKRDAVYEVTMSDGKRQELFEGVKVDDLFEDPDTGLLLGATTLESPYAQFFDNKLQSRFNGTRKAFPGYEMHLVSFSRNMDRLIVNTDGGDDSGTYWLVDIGTGKAEPIGYAYPEVRAKDVGSTQWFEYEASDGTRIQAVLTLPPGREAHNLPLVVMPHGGPIGVYDRIGFDWWAQAFASAGYAVLQPNYRGSGGYGEEFRDAGFRQWGRKMQSDLSDGIAALAEKGAIDPRRACIVGGSYGGYAALAGVTLQQGVYRCSVAVAGVADLSRFFQWQVERHGSTNDHTRYWRQVTGADQEGFAAMSALSPSRFAERTDAPVLLIHGKDDTVVPIEQSEIMRDALKRAKKPVEFVRMEGEDHWLSRTKTRTEMLKASVAFVRKHNPPD